MSTHEQRTGSSTRAERARAYSKAYYALLKANPVAYEIRREYERERIRRLREDPIRHEEQKRRHRVWQRQKYRRLLAARLRRAFVYRKNNPVVFEEPYGPHRPLVQQIIRLVAESHGLTPEIIKGERRCRIVFEARLETIRQIVRFYPDWTLPRIGRELNKDHTSILYGLRKLGLRP
jgi:hypothetical protein